MAQSKILKRYLCPTVFFYRSRSEQLSRDVTNSSRSKQLDDPVFDGDAFFFFLRGFEFGIS